MRLRGASSVKGLACGQHMARAIQEAAENIVGSHGEWFTPSPRCQRGTSCAGTCELLEGRMSKTKEGGKGQWHEEYLVEKYLEEICMPWSWLFFFIWLPSSGILLEPTVNLSSINGVSLPFLPGQEGSHYRRPTDTSPTGCIKTKAKRKRATFQIWSCWTWRFAEENFPVGGRGWNSNSCDVFPPSNATCFHYNWSQIPMWILLESHLWMPMVFIKISEFPVFFWFQKNLKLKYPKRMIFRNKCSTKILQFLRDLP